MLSSVEQAFVGREEIRAPLKTPAWEATGFEARGKKKIIFEAKEWIFSFIPASSVGARYKCLIIEIDLCGLSHVLGKGNRMNRPFS